MRGKAQAMAYMQPRCICLLALLATPLMGCVSEPQQAGPQEEIVAQEDSELDSNERFRQELDELACMLARQQVDAQRERDLRLDAEQRLEGVEQELETALQDKADLTRRLDQAYLDIAALQRSAAGPAVMKVR